MPDEKHQLVNIWDDTVDLRELFIGLACGSTLGFAFYALSLRTLSKYVPHQPAGVIKGYALLGGILGCVCAAVGVALLVKPKRWLRVSDDGPIDRVGLLRSLAVDPDEERLALANASPELIREMQQLQIHDLFAEFSRSGSDAK
jgi:hypothetical protein